MTHRHSIARGGLGLLLACSLPGACAHAAEPVAATAPATGPEADRLTRIRIAQTDVELGMLVVGEVEIDAAGQVLRYTIQHRDRLPKAVTTMIDSRVPLWTFEPVTLPEGQTSTRSLMSLRFVAHRAGESDYAVDLRSVSFQALQPDAPETHELRLVDKSSLEYPRSAARVGVSATVYAALRIDTAGKVTDAAIRQVKLRIDANERQLAFWRGEFAREALLQVKRLRFAPPTTGPDAGTGPWTITFPIDYTLTGEAPWQEPGRWDSYRPGPIAMIPWVSPESRGADAPPDTAIPSRLQTNNEHRRLRKRLSGD